MAPKLKRGQLAHHHHLVVASSSRERKEKRRGLFDSPPPIRNSSRVAASLLPDLDTLPLALFLSHDRHGLVNI